MKRTLHRHCRRSHRGQGGERQCHLLARRCLRYEGSDPFGRRGRAWLELDPHARALTELLLTSIDEADAHVCALTARLHELLDGDDEMRLLQTIPGVGFLTAATLIAELGDAHRFRTAGQVSAYLGVVPRVRASADVAHYGRITRAGSPHARRALVEAATSPYACRGRPATATPHWSDAAARRSPSWPLRVSCSSCPGPCSTEGRCSGPTAWESPFRCAEGAL
jgi:transposase